MNQRTISQFSIFWLVIVLTFGISSAFTVVSKLFERNYVRIFNELDNELLFFHCKSKDDDLGLRNLQPGTYWEFSFHNTLLLQFLAQHSTSAIFGTLTPPKLSFMQFLMYIENLQSSWTDVVHIFVFGRQKRMDYTYIIFKKERLWRCMIGK